MDQNLNERFGRRTDGRKPRAFRQTRSHPQSDVEGDDDAAAQEHQSQQSNQNPEELKRLRSLGTRRR
ncbi:hypothetical protein EYF80_041781 [Liparis tanakae]|uniref:Uncharacterized protein n=1 Tax=Liparis tanakae TaxID=230148 RepID=A0A4Z2G3B7_9TELE|nr:hypothetical protein EYF80_041781 [Liparis tanakae]